MSRTRQGAPGGGVDDPAAFTDVDADEAARARLVAMMDATDAWPAVRAARRWVLERSGIGPGALVVDVGCGPGTFGAAARAPGARTVDVDRSAVMVEVVRERHPAAPATLGDLAGLPLRSAVVDLVHVERVLQWTAAPAPGLAEARRLVAPGGTLAVTDTDWGTFAVDHPGPAAADRLSAAALRWVPHPRLARTLGRWLRDAGASEVSVRTDAVTVTGWDPDDPAQQDGPPGLPLHSIAAAGVDADGGSASDLDALAALARSGRFFATLTLVTAVGRF